MRISNVALGGADIGALWFDTANSVLKVHRGSNIYSNAAEAGSTGATVSATAPVDPNTGAVWYDTTTGVLRLKIWNGTAWVVATPDEGSGGTVHNTIGATVSDTEPSDPVSGALWYDSSEDELKLNVWNGTAWVDATPVTDSVGGGGGGGALLTIQALAGALRLDMPLADGQEAILTRLSSVGSALIDLYAPNAPTAIKQEATIRIAAYLYDQPESPVGARYSMAWRNSGSSALLAPWIVRGATLINAPGISTDTSTDTVASGPIIVTDQNIATYLAGLTSRVEALEAV